MNQEVEKPLLEDKFVEEVNDELKEVTHEAKNLQQTGKIINEMLDEQQTGLIRVEEKVNDSESNVVPGVKNIDASSGLQCSARWKKLLIVLLVLVVLTAIGLIIAGALGYLSPKPAPSSPPPA
eukprot:TRINITY_DN726_c0_g1_i3.p2 TRINITY_DN726_c0_g1~~TRINITY_DN726_c0_g1_i3.p2  ORF type:complete len:123 (-),score=42.72 TRINITY_DN726_c0_g1_i3:88-456(-)